jgi:hypothetical protein
MFSIDINIVSPLFYDPDYGEFRFWQPIFKAPATPMAYIILKYSVYDNTDFSETPNSANNFYSHIP